MPGNINFDALVKQLDKFCPIHDISFSGKSCPKCNEVNNKDDNPNTSNHPADCECERCRSNRWFDNNKPF